MTGNIVYKLKRLLSSIQTQQEKDELLQEKDTGLPGKAVDARILKLKRQLAKKNKRLKEKDAELKEKCEQVMAAIEAANATEASDMEKDILMEDLQMKLQFCEAEIARLGDKFIKAKQRFQKTLIAQANTADARMKAWTK